MKLIHAALALVGWYLVYLPQPWDKPGDMVMVSAFDNAKGCEAAVEKEHQIAASYFGHHPAYANIPISPPFRRRQPSGATFEFWGSPATIRASTEIEADGQFSFEPSGAKTCANG
jgi:hypothetical protein